MDEKRSLLNSYIPLVEFLSQVFGSYCEVVLHDVSEAQESIIAISENNLTGRKKGGTMSPVAQKVLELNRDQDYVINNMEKALQGKDIRSNTYFIKDSSGKMIGMLCVNLDISAPLALRKMLEDLIAIPGAASEPSSARSFSSNLEDYVRLLIDNALKDTAISPTRMTPKEKKAVIKQLNEKGVFRIKGGVSEVCRHLQISEATLYRYLKDIK